MKPLRVAILSSEAVPFAKTGGLADVSGALTKALHAEGVDLSSEMIRYAKSRRGLNLIEADARALPFGDGTYETIIYARGG